MKYESPEEIETDSHWVNSGSKKGCTWWVHTNCANIHYPNNDEWEKIRCMDINTFIAKKKHMPKAEKIVWDRELNREVQLGETSKMSRSILKLKKKNQKK